MGSADLSLWNGSTTFITIQVSYETVDINRIVTNIVEHVYWNRRDYPHIIYSYPNIYANTIEISSTLRYLSTYKSLGSYGYLYTSVRFTDGNEETIDGTSIDVEEHTNLTLVHPNKNRIINNFGIFNNLTIVNDNSRYWMAMLSKNVPEKCFSTQVSLKMCGYENHAHNFQVNTNIAVPTGLSLYLKEVRHHHKQMTRFDSALSNFGNYVHKSEIGVVVTFSDGTQRDQSTGLEKITLNYITTNHENNDCADIVTSVQTADTPDGPITINTGELSIPYVYCKHFTLVGTINIRNVVLQSSLYVEIVNINSCTTSADVFPDGDKQLTETFIASIPLKLWFTKAYRNKKDLKDCHYHEFESWQFDWLLEKSGWRIISRKKWTNPRPFKLGFRPILRLFTPRYYIVYAERIN